MTALIPPDRPLPNQEAIDLVVALQRCLSTFHARADEPALLYGADEPPEMLTRYIKARRLRGTIFGQNLFSDPPWDILLLLFQAELQGRQMTLDQLSETLRISMNTLLGHVGAMERRGLLMEHAGSPAGGRRRMRPSSFAMDAMAAWLSLAFGG
ncbi:hypothetical protein [Sphingobium ummariense]|uniref:HTH marR-type domain-containing protein n=1 Tax=Sphingobium ummariense RL-3 TaxID=1346791 RepID=T0KCT5_9SPHN|nr:hypothetical protein [Sphingobium ummariense]EQB31308.1 hypothetical protein M529_15435 [Sphingobium ummariense RL-3]